MLQLRTLWFWLRLALILGSIGGAAHAQREVWRNSGDVAGDSLGASVTYVPDQNGDGVADCLVGAPGGHARKPGRVFLYSGAENSVLRKFDGDTPNDLFGNIVDDLGDVDGDGVRDFAISAPDRSLPGLPKGAVFVYSGTGALIRTFTSASTSGQIGQQMTTLGDIDGDGLRELLFNEVSSSAFTVSLVSGSTGSLIRQHTGPSDRRYGYRVGQLGDVDADNIDDYAISDFYSSGYGYSTSWHGSVYVYSGSTGLLMFSMPAGWTIAVGAAGDVDLDGHADPIILFQGNWNEYPAAAVFSGLTGSRLYYLTNGSGGAAGFSVSATRDFDGDGHSDLVMGGGVFSGKSGNEIVNYRMGDSPIYSVDATEDVNGDGTCDTLAGMPDDGRVGGISYYAGRMSIVSLADGSILESNAGDGFASFYGSCATVLPDRDGDGFREIAVAVPGGLDSTVGFVQIVSGLDGHELSRVQPEMEVSYGKRSLVSLSDINGDGIEELVLSRGDGIVEVRSGADDSVITELVPPSGSLTDIAAATDLNGTALLAIGTTAAGPTTVVYLYDLTNGLRQGEFSGHGATGIACVGDVNGDGLVDWTVCNPTDFGAFRGTVTVFSGGSSHTLIWEVTGSANHNIRDVGRSGDLNTDGIDDVLIFSDFSDAGTVTARSGKDGSKLFRLDGEKTYDGFGWSMSGLGDVNRDGVVDFAIGAPSYRSYGGSIYIYSGRTTGLLYRFDGDESSTLGIMLAPLVWDDDSHVDPDEIPDLLTGSPNSESYRGFAELFQLDDLFLQIDPPGAAAGQTVEFDTRGGPTGNFAGLFALDFSDTPLNYFIALGAFDSLGIWSLSAIVPPGLSGNSMTFRSYAIGFSGKVIDSQDAAVFFQ